MSFELPQLPYAYDALEPHIDARTMEIHHSKHHQGYTNNLNNAISGTELEGKSILEILSNCSDKPAIRNNGGGFYNHCLFWDVMSPNGGGTPTGALADAIDEAFTSFDAFKDTFSKAAATRFGSGWAWLVVTPQKKLAVTSSPNQDNPIMDVSEIRGIPILGIDVWEHAYYLKYQNKRGDYLSAIWSILDWSVVADKYNAAIKDPLLQTIEKEHWPELMHFHKVLAQTFHPVEKNDFEPLRARSSELYAKSILLKTSEVPNPLMSPEILGALTRLEKQCGSLDKCVRKNAKNKTILKKIVMVHDTFHEIQGMCHDKK